MCNLWLLLISIVIIPQSFAQSCGSCDTVSCEPPRNCLAGLVKDSCDCCYVCGRREGERCDHRSLNEVGYGSCGDRLECRLRTDLDEEDHPEASCFCIFNSPLCGSDGITYENTCQLTEARYRKRNGLRAVSREPCTSKPNIVKSRMFIENESGNNVAVMCDVLGWPIPTITWQFTSSSIQFSVPGNDSSISVQTRNGPGTTEITSWLLFSNFSEDQVGQYTCTATNEYGADTYFVYVYIP